MEYLTIKETCELLRVSRQTLYNWIQKDKIRYLKIDKEIRIPKEQFKEMEGGQ